MHVSIFARLLTCFLLGLSGLAGCSKTDPLQPPAADGSVSADRSVSGDGSVSADGSEPTLEKVTKALSSNMSGELSLPNGAKIAIPLWGLPVGPQGGAAIEFSLAAAALCVQHHGAGSSMRSRAEIDAELFAGA